MKKIRQNLCKRCFGKEGNDCCIDFFIVLNSEELHLFEGFSDFKRIDDGGLFYTRHRCPYLDKENNCVIHQKKPLYCEFYPIFITGEVYIDDNCPLYQLEKYQISEDVKTKVNLLQKQFPIYKKDWFFSEVLLEFQE